MDFGDGVDPCLRPKLHDMHGIQRHGVPERNLVAFPRAKEGAVMSEVTGEMKPRRMVFSNDPSQHVRPGQFVLALAITAAAAAFWGFVTKSFLVVIMVGTTQLITIW